MTEDKILSQWNTYCSLANKLNRPGVSELLDTLGERLILCSASQTTEYSGCGPGGLIETSLSVTSKMRSMSRALEVQVDTASVITVGLFHAIGMVGSVEQPYLIEQTSNWHRDRGVLYEFNPVLPKSPVSHRSLQLLQEFGVRLSFEEWVSIALSGGPTRDESKFYGGFEPPLAVLLYQARQWTVAKKF